MCPIQCLLLMSLHFINVMPYQHQQPYIDTSISACVGGKQLNDCNWCTCKGGSFSCDTRPCNTVDMFGPIKDAIQDINVGMEGHGSWRSKPTACEADVPYRKGDIVCVCNEDGYWPSAVCRETFRVLHPVKKIAKVDKNTRCQPSHYFLSGCEVCYCPETGLITPQFCKKINCTDSDPILKTDEDNELENKTIAKEIYSTCNEGSNYTFVCRKCNCLSNNRLVCDNTTCPQRKQPKGKDLVVDIVALHAKNGKHCPKGMSYKVDCNYCFCLPDGNALCTSNRCK